jgi:hypothetical protein
MIKINPSTSADMIIDTILYHQIKTDYSNVEYDIDNVYDYKNKNVYIFISRESLSDVKDFYINDKDAPLIDQNL